MSVDFTAAQRRFDKQHEKIVESLKLLERASMRNLVQISREFTEDDDMQVYCAARMLDVNKAFDAIRDNMNGIMDAVSTGFGYLGDSEEEEDGESDDDEDEEDEGDEEDREKTAKRVYTFFLGFLASGIPVGVSFRSDDAGYHRLYRKAANGDILYVGPLHEDAVEVAVEDGALVLSGGKDAISKTFAHRLSSKHWTNVK